MNAPIRRTIPATVLNSEFVVFCVGQEDKRRADFEQFAKFAGFFIKPLIGSYKGEVENSYLAPINAWVNIAPWIMEEESVLLLGPKDKLGRRGASLLYVDSGEEVKLGKFQSVSEEIAKTHEAWTYDPKQNEYFLAA